MKAWDIYIHNSMIAVPGEAGVLIKFTQKLCHHNQYISNTGLYGGTYLYLPAPQKPGMIKTGKTILICFPTETSESSDYYQPEYTSLETSIVDDIINIISQSCFRK